MIPDAKPQAVADVRTRYKKNLNGLKETANNGKEGLTNQGQPKQPVIDLNGWSGNLFEIEQLGKPFDREENEQDVQDSIKNVRKPGTVSDLAASQLQGDQLGAMERSFRLLHSTSVRLKIQASARMYGHGHDAGIFQRGLLDYVSNIIRQGRGT